MVQIGSRSLVLYTQLILMFALWVICSLPQIAAAVNITEYKDTLSDSGPSERSNHTISFTLNTDVSPGGYIEIVPPSGFTILSTSTFAERNIELRVDGTARPAAATSSSGVDAVSITPGSPGVIRYTLAPDFSVSTGSNLELRIGNHTSGSLQPVTTYSTSTGTTTTPGDIEPIVNANATGSHEVQVEVYDGTRVANAHFVVFLNEKVRIPSVDTTETIPPERFNGAPTSTLGGTTLNVEISLETNEFAICKYSTASGTPYTTMSDTFSNTGLIFHSSVVPVTPDSFQRFYVRCIDDEGNYNTDDFIIAFAVNEQPTGQSTTDGNVQGSGTGEGSEGTGDGSGGGGTTGESDGELNTEGGDSGGGGSGGGGGGGSGEDFGDTAGGGFESDDAPYQSGDGRVIISGYAFPNSTVGILVDGNFFDTTQANTSGSYSITLDEIARGVYTFGVYAEGSDDVRSSTFSTSFTVTGARTSELSNINVSPSVLVSPDPVEPGETLTASGYALGDSEVIIENGRINSSLARTITATADASGRWSATIDTSGFSVDTYQIRAKSEQPDGEETSFSDYTFYGVGQEADIPINADLNRDGDVNLIDFSILLFWWNSDGGDSDPSADINGDGTVSLTDFSIMLFNWTG